MKTEMSLCPEGTWFKKKNPNKALSWLLMSSIGIFYLKKHKNMNIQALIATSMSSKDLKRLACIAKVESFCICV